MKIERFEDLDIWQESRELCKKVSDITRNGEFSKDFKFRDQIRDSSGSTMDCIAEGFERDGVREFIQLLFNHRSEAEVNVKYRKGVLWRNTLTKLQSL